MVIVQLVCISSENSEKEEVSSNVLMLDLLQLLMITHRSGLCGTELFLVGFFFFHPNFLSYVCIGFGRVLGIMTPLSGKETSINKKYRYYLNIRKSFIVALGQLLLRGTLPIVKHLICISSLKWVLFVVYVLTK